MREYKEQLVKLRNDNKQLIFKKGIDNTKDPYDKLETELLLKR